MNYLYHVTIAPGIHYDALGDEGLNLTSGDEVVLRCDRYQDYGIVTCCRSNDPVDEQTLQERTAKRTRGRRVEGTRVPKIIRRATLIDKGKAHENETRAKSMHRQALAKIEEHELPMKLVNTHYAFDKRLVVFQFSAEGRVDFRDLLRDLSRELHTRVELRQIGVRDEAAIQGGLGACGRPFCCSTFLTRFVSINVKMAKQQGLSLNPSNISGACGRLKCCLNYEADWYRQNPRDKRNPRQDTPAPRPAPAES